ncbi:MAG: heme lyase CcmF/NrfE family subunit [Gemmatimonadota bacterium]
MLSLLGTAAVAAAFLGAGAAFLTGAVGGRGGRPALVQAARFGIYTTFFSMTVAMVVMEIALLTHDFSVEYVASVGSRQTPPFYTAISLWSSLDGSILFWGWILSAYAALVAFVNRNRPAYARYMPYVHATLGVVGLFFYGLLLGPASPFGRVFPVPPDGPGPNPLLQNHPLMGLHPPMLYLGYVGLSVPFAFAIAALVSGDLGQGWLRAARRWTVAAWAFLSVGIVAGGWWSYEVLGWGGVWAWDPVENASFLPWLTATAFLHSAMVQERREMLKTWNLSLVIGTFLLTLLGTFLTRSGILDSVHAFTEGLIGPLFLGFITLVALASLALIGWRSNRLYAPGTLDGVASRESAFIVNNLLFVAFTFTVLLGTMWPLVVEATGGRRISVGPPYFDMVAVPIGLAILFLMGVGPALPWRRAGLDRLKRSFLWPTGVGLIFAAAALLIGVRRPYPIVTFAFAGFVLTTIVEEFRRGISARRRISGGSTGSAFLELLSRNGRRYGGYTVHLGVVVIIVALAISGSWKTEREQTLRQGEELAIGEYGVRFEEVWARQEPQRFVVGSTFAIRKNGRPIGELEPRLNFYPTSEQPISTPAVRSSLREDLYLTLMAFDPEQGAHATVRAIVNPAVPWLWIGGVIVALGGILAIRPTGVRRRAPERTLSESAAPPPRSEERETVPV